MRRPKALTAVELDKFGIVLVSGSHMVLQCQHCRAEWRLIKPPRGCIPRKSWKCLNGCTANHA
jgi:hypothetical protein